MHIELREWAHILVVAPLSANTLAKFAAGICDNMLLCVARAWKFGSQSKSSGNVTQVSSEDELYGSKPIILAPAMNTAMWEHPLTHRQVQTIQSFSSSIYVVQPQAKELACGEIGNGALATVDDIINATKKCLLTRQRLRKYSSHKY
jgi:phosphopantothenoylcysteine decarboxylase